MTVVSMNYLLEAGVHFGHQKRRWNPKMKEYIYTTRDDIYIIDLQKTAKKIEEAYAALNEIAKNGGKTIFVGTRKQAQEAVKEEATKSDSYYITERWLGGTLTNFRTIRNRVKRLELIEKRFEEINELLISPEVISNVRKSKELAIELSTIEDTVKCFREYRSVLNDLEEANLMLEDEELASFATEEIEGLNVKKSDFIHFSR